MREYLQKLKKSIPTILVLLGFSIAAEFLLFNYRSLTTADNTRMELLKDLELTGPKEYESFHASPDAVVDNVCLSGVEIEGADHFDAAVELSDEGNGYVYPLADFRVFRDAEGIGYADIYAYGKVREICVRIKVPEGATVRIANISFNIRKPFTILPLRIFLVFLCLGWIVLCWGRIVTTPCRRRSIPQMACVAASIVFLILLGKKLAFCNEKLIEDPPSHHAQYRELAEALEEGHVSLDGKEVDPALAAKENPYDTMSLLAEGVPFSMDYAYYEGKYYAYFGIIPEILFYYPYLKIKGETPQNASAQWRFYALLVCGAFLFCRELVERFRKGEFPFFLYLAMSWMLALWGNHVFLVSRPDIYNIPVLAGVAFTVLGLGAWFGAANRKGRIRIPFLLVGSFCMACVAGCRPQMLLFSGLCLPLFLFPEKEGKLSLRERTLLTKKSIPETLSFILPYVVVAIPVCWYNAARFGSIFEFGATFSLTSNDMNLRGFNLDRLLRGLYCFLFQPTVTTTDFPYLTSSVLESSYMGRNIVEFTFGGLFAACPLLLAVFAPLFGRWKKMSASERALYIGFFAASLVIAAFDVNGAGILYRYSCDFTAGFLLCALLVWVPLLSEEKNALARRLFSLLLLQALFYSLRLFCADGDFLFIRDCSPRLWAQIRRYFI